MSYAHSHDVVRRDIKPENILLESGHAVVADVERQGTLPPNIAAAAGVGSGAVTSFAPCPPEQLPTAGPLPPFRRPLRPAAS